MSRASLVSSFVVVIILTIGHTAADAQSIGTFRWQLQPYCNVVTLSVTQAGGVYTVDGFDDQCGAATRAPVTGAAVPNPDGTIEIGFGIVASPDARPVHVAVAINTATLGGTWTDSAGHRGTFAFRPNGGTGGAPRPAATGALGAAEVNPEQVQLRVSGACLSGQAIEQIEQDGTVSCAPTGSGDITEIVTPEGSGLTGGATDGVASLGLARTTSRAFDLSNAYGVGTNQNSYSTYAGNTPWTGGGKRMFWHTPKAAFRAGMVAGNHWDDSNIGGASAAFGSDTTASGAYSFAAGASITASGQSAMAMGTTLNAAGGWSVVLGTLAGTTAAGEGSFVYGDRTLGPVFQSTAPNQFLVRASGGTTFYSNYVLSSGVRLAPNASAWSSLSDVNSKENFRDLDGADVLAKIAGMPIREWNYKAQDAAIRHVGPTAQDFYAAFGLGEDPLRISTIDADGIALAAVKALALENAGLKAELAALRERLDHLEGNLGSFEADAELSGDHGEPWIGRPQAGPSHQRGGEQMSVDPSDAPAVESAVAHERDDLAVRNGWRLMYQGVVGEQCTTATLVTNEQFAEDELVPADLALTQQVCQTCGVRRLVGQEPDPDGRVDQDHYATECFALAGASRRR